MVATKPVIKKEAEKTVAAKKPMAPKAISKENNAKSAVSKKATQSQVPTRRPPKKEKPMKQIFKGFVISASDTFINSAKTVTHEQLARYVTSHGAEYERAVTNDTTHLICSIEEYKKKTAQGKFLSYLLAYAVDNLFLQ
jgi:hypothetical protein